MSTTATTRRTFLSPLTLLLALTFSTGVVDAVSYLGLDRVFTGNMTGNVVVLGMGLAGGGKLPVLGPLLALMGFALGAAAAGRFLRTVGLGWTTGTVRVLGAVAAVFGVVAVLVASVSLTHEVDVLATTALGLAMGAQAGAGRHVGISDVSTVVVTSTITGLAADLALGTATGAVVRRRSGAVVAIVAGAFTGGAVLHWHTWSGLALAAVITVTVALIGHHRLRPA